MKRIVVLISGQGSNMQAVAQACRQQAWPAEVVAVISNRPEAAGLSLAHQLQIDTRVVDHRAHASRESFDAELAAAVQAWQPDLVLLAGFMRVLTPAFVDAHAGRLMNIHPSLLPAFPGLHTHRRALEAGCKLSGATVHLVGHELDHGPIVMQGAVPVRPGDDAATLAARVLAVEHRIYPQAVRWWCEDRLQIQGGRVLQRDGEPQWLWLDDAGA